ncbi:hypothetical protein K437DRAFT_293094 [Tilletiaria anomala UBC 951]|uniref:ADF-H domain-containing protein n=1 Tax=Tilletiaria anomala (strain ATCC 24038 / CBS 436.72 / UBC 951) TaxID=1037660 RepID=A0A066WNX8_TILAU|nr:uncharacterized protein K437DRAFT_293094 [Tilletiaria anomala UBC 951]KDN52310.1 hypothetical protein K437DRAFT_293094 [Tilletiaria anomala UBC 951]
MSVSLSDPRIQLAYNELQSASAGTGSNVILGYFGSNSISLHNQGTGGVEEIRSYLDPSEVRFILLKYEGKFLFIQFMGENISGVKRARALVHGRAVSKLFVCQDASMLLTSPAEVTEQTVRSKLRILPATSGSGLGITQQPQRQLVESTDARSVICASTYMSAARNRASTSSDTGTERSTGTHQPYAYSSTSTQFPLQNLPVNVGPRLPADAPVLPSVAPLNLSRKTSSSKLVSSSNAAVPAPAHVTSDTNGTAGAQTHDLPSDSPAARKRSGSGGSSRSTRKQDEWAETLAHPLPSNVVAQGRKGTQNQASDHAADVNGSGTSPSSFSKSGYNPLAAAAAAAAAGSERGSPAQKMSQSQTTDRCNPSGEQPVIIQYIQPGSSAGCDAQSSSAGSKQAALFPQPPSDHASAPNVNNILESITSPSASDEVKARGHGRSVSANISSLDPRFGSTQWLPPGQAHLRTKEQDKENGREREHSRSFSASFPTPPHCSSPSSILERGTPASERAYRRRLEASGLEGESWISQHSRKYFEREDDERGYVQRYRGSPPSQDGPQAFLQQQYGQQKSLPSTPPQVGTPERPHSRADQIGVHSDAILDAFSPDTIKAIEARRRFDTAEHATQMQLQKARAKQASVSMQIREIERREIERAQGEEMTRKIWNRELYIRERLDAFERSKLESAERLRRAGLEQVRREEARKLDQLKREKRQAHEEEKEALEESERRQRDSAAREARMRLAAQERKQREAEAAARKEAKLAERKSLKVEFQKLSALDKRAVIMSGGISVQQPNSTIFKRRFYQLFSTELLIFKSEDDMKDVLLNVGLQDTVSKIEDAFEEVQMAHSFCITLKPPMDPFTAYMDSKEQKDLLLTAIEVISRRE